MVVTGGLLIVMMTNVMLLGFDSFWWCVRRCASRLWRFYSINMSSRMCSRRRLVMSMVMITVINIIVVAGFSNRWCLFILSSLCWAQSIWTVFGDSLKYFTTLNILLFIEVVRAIIDWLSISIEAEIFFGIDDGGKHWVAAVHLFFEEAVFRKTFLLSKNEKKSKC